jgi:hypothetical protein
MDCPIHSKPMQVVCGTLSCGDCYLAGLMAEPMPRQRQKAQVEVRYVESAHRKMVLRKRGK